MQSVSTIGIITLLLTNGCVVKSIDVLPGVPLRITRATVTQDPDVRQGGKWVASHGRVTIEPGELVAVPLPPTTRASQ